MMSKSTQITNQLPTGQEFLVTLQDGREVWFDGERVADVTTHPAFRNSVRSVARLYDALHNPALKDDLTLVDKFGITTHKFFAPSYSAEELIAARSSFRDLQAPELQPLIDRYYRGTGLTGPERIKLFKLIWDALYSEFAARHALYERNYAGNQEQQRLDALNWSQIRGDTDRYKALVDQCLSDYDLSGWTAADWQS